jgi:hypothetical protein
MKLTIKKAKKIIVQTPDTFIVEFTEQELIDILAMSSHIGGFMHSTGRNSWATFASKVPIDIKLKADTLGGLLTNYNEFESNRIPVSVGAYYPEDGINR